MGASPVRPEIYEQVKSRNFTPEQQEKIDFFLLRGGFDQRKLTAVDSILMKMLKLQLKRKKHPTADEQGMLAAYFHPVNFTNKKSIEPILAKLKR